MPQAELRSGDLAQLAATTELMEREWAPCRDACPVHADVRKYLEHIARAEWREAIDVSTSPSPPSAGASATTPARTTAAATRWTTRWPSGN